MDAPIKSGHDIIWVRICRLPQYCLGTDTAFTGWKGHIHKLRKEKETIMKLTRTLLMTAAVAVLSTAAIAAEGSTNTDGTHNANNTQTDTNMGANANANISNDAAADVNANASTEAEMSDTSNDINTGTDTNVNAAGNTVGSTVGTATGIVGGVAGTATNTANGAIDMSASTVRDVQESLRDQGHKVSVDCKWGARTQAALRDFQKANSLPATGKLNAETMAALNIQQ